MLKEKPYTQKEAEAVTGLGADNNKPEAPAEIAMDVEQPAPS